MLIRELNEDEKPREKLLKKGVKNLSDSELLAIILRTGTNKINVIDLSRKIINEFGLEKLSTCTVKELTSIKGVGLVKACQIISIFELTQRCKHSKTIFIKQPEDVYNYSKQLVSGIKKEIFLIIILDTKNKIIKHEIISIGTLDSSLIHPREVFNPAIKESANSIILVHNHPSGDPEPSQEDIDVTKKLEEAGNLIGINVLDHIIIGSDSFWSFKQKI